MTKVQRRHTSIQNAYGALSIGGMRKRKPSPESFSFSHHFSFPFSSFSLPCCALSPNAPYTLGDPHSAGRRDPNDIVHVGVLVSGGWQGTSEGSAEEILEITEQEKTFRVFFFFFFTHGLSSGTPPIRSIPPSFTFSLTARGPRVRWRIFTSQ